MSIAEYRRKNAQSVLDSIEKEYPQRKPHSKPAIRHNEAAVSIRGGNFSMPGDE